MKNIDKVAKVITRVVEIFHWVGAALMAAAAVSAIVAPEYLGYFVGLDIGQFGTELSVYGFEVMIPVHNGMLDMSVFAAFAFGSVIILMFMAMIFRNLHLIFKLSEGTTPFQKDNVRMVREIGIFSIAIPIIGLIMGTVCRIMIGVETAEISVGIQGLVMGIVVLCLSRFFAHGMELENDVEGLL